MKIRQRWPSKIAAFSRVRGVNGLIVLVVAEVVAAERAVLLKDAYRRRYRPRPTDTTFLAVCLSPAHVCWPRNLLVWTPPNLRLASGEDMIKQQHHRLVSTVVAPWRWGCGHSHFQSQYSCAIYNHHDHPSPEKLIRPCSLKKHECFLLLRTITVLFSSPMLLIFLVRIKFFYRSRHAVSSQGIDICVMFFNIIITFIIPRDFHLLDNQNYADFVVVAKEKYASEC